MKRQSLKGSLALGVALGVLAWAPTARAADAAMSTSMSGSMSSAPTMVTGRVNNYWTDPSGFVTAVDVQTASGPAVVRFGPGMGNRVMQTYPVGSTANLWVQGSMKEGVTQWDMVGMGSKQPSAWWPVTSVDPYDLVTGWPMVDAGAGRVTVEGKLRRVVVDRMGQVVGLVLDTTRISNGTPKTVLLTLGDASDLMRTGETIWDSKSGGSASTLVRVGPEFRPTPDHGNNMRRVTPLLAGDSVIATGYMEASRYGTVSTFGQRLSASAIVVNGRNAGQLGFPLMKPNEPVILGFDLSIPFITGKAPDSLQVVPGGNEVYSGSSGMTSGSSMMSAPVK